jgi:two-component sensor histidine kinase
MVRLPTIRLGAEMLSNGAADLITIPSFWLFALLASVYLRRSGREVDQAAVALAAEHSARAADAAALRAQAEARLESDRNFRMLHDTVLSTLAAAASGSVAPERLAERAIVDERLLRLMINGQVTGDPRSLTDRLAAAAARWELDGLRVDLVLDRSAPDPPPEVVHALAEAAEAALANVARHAGTGEAWMTVSMDHAESTVAVVDHGSGFALDMVRTDAYGVRESIIGRMEACGGAADIHSSTDGTSVRLVWPRPGGLSRPPS